MAGAAAKETATPAAAAARRAFPSASVLVVVAAVLLKVLSTFLFTQMGVHLDRHEPSHFFHEAALLGIDRVERVPVRLGEQTLHMTVLVKKALAVDDQEQEAPTVVLLHGFPDDAATFYMQIGAFSAHGFDVVIPILPGYEPATALLPPATYALPALAGLLDQVLDWAVASKTKHTQVHLLGHDWGAVLGYILARANSPSASKIASLVTVAVPHNALYGIMGHKRQFVNSWYMLFIQIPFLPEFWFRTFGYWVGLRKLWKDWSPGYTAPTPITASLHATFSQPGVLMSSLQYYRANVPPMLKTFSRMVLGLEETRQGDFVVGVPCLAVLGLQDGCMSKKVYDLTMGTEADGLQTSHPFFSAGVQVRGVEGAGHFVHQEKPAEVNKLLLAGFTVHGGTGGGK